MELLDLMNIPKNTISKNLTSYNYLFYAMPGMGKTTFAVDLFDQESALLLAFEMGAKGIPNARPIPIPDYQTFLAYVDALCEPEVVEKYKVLIFDTATKLGECIEEYILSMFGKNSIGECKAHGAAYSLINRFWNVPMNKLKAAGYSFVYIAHAEETNLKNANGEEIGKYYSPKLSSRIAGLIEPETDFTFLITLNQKNERIICTDNTTKCKGKQRTPLKTILPLDVEIFKEEFYKGIDIKSNGKATTKRNKTTISEYKKSERDYKEVVEEIKKLGTIAKEKGEFIQAVELINNSLGQDDLGQRTLDKCTQANIQVLEVIKRELEELVSK